MNGKMSELGAELTNVDEIQFLAHLRELKNRTDPFEGYNEALAWLPAELNKITDTKSKQALETFAHNLLKNSPVEIKYKDSSGNIITKKLQRDDANKTLQLI